LSHDPNDRFPSMAELLHALERDKRSRRKLWLGVLGALLLCGATAVGTAIALAPEPTAQDLGRIDALAAAARDAAEHGRFLYPAADDPDGSTAYAQIAALEAIDGPAEAKAH